MTQHSIVPADLTPLTADEIADLRQTYAGDDPVVVGPVLIRRLCDAAAAKDAEIAELRERIARLSAGERVAIDDVPLAAECADRATMLRFTVFVRGSETDLSPVMEATADLLERTAVALTKLPSAELRQRAERTEEGLVEVKAALSSMARELRETKEAALRKGAELTKRAERAEADARRLDWIEANPDALFGAVRMPDSAADVEWVALPVGPMPVTVPHFKTPREAIDAAMNLEQRSDQ